MEATEFLYRTKAGRMLLKLLVQPQVSKLAGSFLDSQASTCLIKRFISKYDIQMEEYPQLTYRSFNDFFCRQIRPELRPIDREPDHLVAPCDGLLRVYPIHDELVAPIKQSAYSMESLLGSKALAEEFDGGYCLVFRLCVNHYHRYCYADGGRKSANITIPGLLHTVRPIALRKLPVFAENAREYTVIESENFGKMIQMEVGAMLVGRILNHHQEAEVKRGQEKGYFQYGGSTVILLVKKNKVSISKKLLGDREIPVKMGQMLGKKLP